MTLVDLISKVNAALAGEILSYQDIEPLADAVIDDINAKLDSTFPTFSELKKIHKGAPPIEYTKIPERYMRTVVVQGIAYKFYVMDEEGIDTAQTYGLQYEKALFEMLRDYGDKVPAEFLADEQTGSLTCDPYFGYTGGVDVDEPVWYI